MGTTHVKVELEGVLTPESVESIIEIWRSQYPQAKAESLVGYGQCKLTLVMPPQTTVVIPQLVDARAEQVDE